MSISRAVARPLLAAMFIAGGWDSFRNPGAKVKAAEPVVLPITERVAILPEDTEKVVQLNGAVMVGAGTLLALGKFRRLAALVLIGSIIPTTLAGHRFWEEEDEATRAQQRIQFLKNLGLLGGLILELFDTEGSPSLMWRMQARKARRSSADKGGSELAKQISGGIGAAQGKLSQAAEASGPAIEHARTAAARVPEMSSQAWKQAQQRAAQIDISRQAAALKDAQAAMVRAADSYRAAATNAQKRAAQVDLTDQKAALRDAQKAFASAASSAATRGRVKAQPVLDSAQPLLAKAQPVVAKAQPYLASAASRASDVWSRVPVGS